jgi:G3E family GTPase
MTTPIWLVVGFLGAGKTTVLRHLVRHASERNYIFLVNEFSAVDVDAGLIEREGGLAITVAGGSIFCRCRVTEFIEALTRVADGIQKPNGEIVQSEGVIIEASGMADPRSMRRLLTESQLDKRYHVAGVVAVVDPGVLMKLLLVLPNIRGQITSADLILLNKVDLHNPETIAKVREKISSINPDATIIRCTHGNVSPEIIFADSPSSRIAQVDAEFGLCQDPNFEREVVHFKTPVDAEKLRAIFADANADGLYRAKGVVNTTDGWQYLDWSNGEFSLVPCPAGDTSSIVLIWNPFLANAVSAQLHALTS